jgi:hypothetical protein
VNPIVRAGRFAFLLAIALPLGCVNPFKPADPEAGSGSGISEDFHDPETALETMVLAMESKSVAGQNAWVHAFAESTKLGDRAYRAFYDPAVQQIWEAANNPQKAQEPWTIDLESRLLPKIFGFRPQAEYAFEWKPDVSQNDDGTSGDTAQFHRQYILIATEGSVSDTIAIGFCDLAFQRNPVGSRWSIYRWNDRHDPTVGANPSSDKQTMSWWRMESVVR